MAFAMLHSEPQPETRCGDLFPGPGEQLKSFKLARISAFAGLLPIRANADRWIRRGPDGNSTARGGRKLSRLVKVW